MKSNLVPYFLKTFDFTKFLHKNRRSLSSAVWKCHDFSIIQNLREINFVHSRSAKSAISTHLEALDFHFDEFLQFLKAEIAKIAVLEELLDSTKLISRKILNDRKLLKFPHCITQYRLSNLGSRNLYTTSNKLMISRKNV